jgi:hypothetical protein
MKKGSKNMKNTKSLFARTMLSIALLGTALLSSCGAQKLAGDYKYIGFNGITQSEEDWKLVVASDNTYTLSLTNDFINAEHYGTVSKNTDGTYTLKHTKSKDAAYPYPTIVYGFYATDTAGTQWQCIGNFDFKAMTFTPNKPAVETSISLPPLTSGSGNASTSVSA